MECPELLERAWQALEDSPERRFERFSVARFLEQAIAAAETYDQRGDSARAEECRMAIRWTQDRLRWLDRTS